MFLLINKPKGITSHDVVDKVRKLTGERRVGHAGTLDPNATGLLIIGVGRESTKKLWEITKGAKKEYLAEIFLGEERDTDDTEGALINKVHDFISPSEEEVNNILKKFIGEKMQIPPMYSAIKIDGKKLYEIARKDNSLSLRLRIEKQSQNDENSHPEFSSGSKILNSRTMLLGTNPELNGTGQVQNDIERINLIKPRKVIIYKLSVISYKFPYLNIKCLVSGGTYIRSLARDIGRELGCGGFLNNLERTKIGKYSLKNAVRLDELNEENWKKIRFCLMVVGVRPFWIL